LTVHAKDTRLFSELKDQWGSRPAPRPDRTPPEASADGRSGTARAEAL
jgi:hypothetical protein